MARKSKIGIDYFSHDVHSTTDRKLRLLKAKHKVVGYGIYFLLLEEIYKEGYCLHITDEFNILFVSEHNLDENVYINCLNDCINFGLFDDKMYKNHSVLTSRRIQTNYIEAVSRRKGIEIDENILMINVDILPDNVNISTQKRREEKKVDKKKHYFTNDVIDEIYNIYPKKQGKFSGYEKLKKMIYTDELKDTMIKQIEECKKNTTEKKFHRQFSTWVNQRGWEDYEGSTIIKTSLTNEELDAKFN